MFRRRTIGTTGLIAAVITMSLNAQTIPWIADVKKGMAEAERLSMPMLFYIGAAKTDTEAHDEAQQRSLTAPEVCTIASERFVPIRLRESATTRVLMEQMQAHDATAFSIVTATPKGRLLRTIPASEVAQPDKLVGELMAISREYGTELFQSDLKAKLENENSRPKELTAALELIEKLLIVDADSSVIGLLERETLPDAVKTQAYETLAALSTRRATEALLSAALRGEAAKTALAKCTPDAAEVLVAALDPKELDKLRIVCSAVSRMCGIADCDPGLFAPDVDRQLHKKEIERLKSAAAQCAKEWRAESQDGR